jgi:hypothetical protein
MNRRRFFKQSAASALSATMGQRLLLAAVDTEVERVAGKLVTAATDKAIDLGLAYLASRQGEDGSLGSGGYDRNAAVCALGGMAFVSSGSTPGRGPWGAHVDRCIDYLISITTDSGYIQAPGDIAQRGMYGHGFATMFLAEVYGMTMRGDLREKLETAVELIVSTQNKEGGWRYQPIRDQADISVTICQVMALRAAKNAGLYVPRETIDRCVDYVKRSQNADGGFMYMLQAGGQSQFPRSAAGIVALFSAGVYEGPEVENGLKYLMQFLPRDEEYISRENYSHYFYGQYYAAQAMWHAGGEHWSRWYPRIRDILIAHQRDDGSWMDNICSEYATAMACIILQIPNNYLPIFQR